MSARPLFAKLLEGGGGTGKAPAQSRANTGAERASRQPALGAESGERAEFGTDARPMPVVAVVAVSFFVALTVALAWLLNIWQDEAFTLHSTDHGFVSGFLNGVTFEVQAPLYFGFLGAWRTIDHSIFFARLPSIVFSLLTLFFTWKFARRYLRRFSASVAVAAVALNPFTIWAAVEMRPYAAAIALSFALVYYFFRGWIESEPDLRARIAFVVVATLGAYTQYYIATFVAAGAVVMLLTSPPRRIIAYGIACGAVTVLLLPIATFLPAQLTSYAGISAASPIPLTAGLFALLGFVLPHDAIGSWRHNVVANLAYLSALSVPAILAIRSIRTVHLTTRILATLTAALMVIFTTMTGMFEIHVVFPRQAAMLFAPTMFTLLSTIADVPIPTRKRVEQLFGCAYIAFALLTIWTTYRGMSKNGDWVRVAQYLNGHVAAADAVAVFDAEAELPLSYYYTGRAPITAIPRSQRFDRFDPERFVIRSVAELDGSIGRAATHTRRTWLVLTGVCQELPIFYNCDLLDRYIARHFTKIATTSFNGTSVIELRPTLESPVNHAAAHVPNSRIAGIQRRPKVGIYAVQTVGIAQKR